MATPRPPASPPEIDGRLHRTILDNLADGVYYVDRERTITYWNRGATEMTGYAADDVVGRRCYSDLLAHVDDEGRSLCRGRCPLAATIADGERRESVIWYRHRDGSRRPVRVRTAPIHADGAIVGAVEIFDDAAAFVATREAADSARRDSLTDPLTGLPNRRMFDLMLDARLKDRARHGTSIGLLFADIDHFKRVNDDHGHAFGDEVLAGIARTLRGGIRAADLVARWGGEEFVVLATETGEADLHAAAERIRALVAATGFVTPAGAMVAPTISIGGAVADHRDTPLLLFARADAALLAAKQGGRDRTVMHLPGQAIALD